MDPPRHLPLPLLHRQRQRQRRPPVRRGEGRRQGVHVVVQGHHQGRHRGRHRHRVVVVVVVVVVVIALLHAHCQLRGRGQQRRAVVPAAVRPRQQPPTGLGVLLPPQAEAPRRLVQGRLDFLRLERPFLVHGRHGQHAAAAAAAAACVRAAVRADAAGQHPAAATAAAVEGVVVEEQRGTVGRAFAIVRGRPRLHAVRRCPHGGGGGEGDQRPGPLPIHGECLWCGGDRDGGADDGRRVLQRRQVVDDLPDHVGQHRRRGDRHQGGHGQHRQGRVLLVQYEGGTRGGQRRRRQPRFRMPVPATRRDVAATERMLLQPRLLLLLLLLLLVVLLLATHAERWHVVRRRRRG